MPDTSNSSCGTETDELEIIANAAAGPYIDLNRGSHKIFIQELPNERPRRTFIQAPRHRIFKVLMRGPLQEDFVRIPARASRKDLQEVSYKHL